MMRKLLFSLSALVLVAFPAHAQTPAPAPQHGLKAGSIALVVTGEVLPGQMDNFFSTTGDKAGGGGGRRAGDTCL
jgi:hypothetical protein